jgi:hypothetical protein
LSVHSEEIKAGHDGVHDAHERRKPMLSDTDTAPLDAVPVRIGVSAPVKGRGRGASALVVASGRVRARQERKRETWGESAPARPSTSPVSVKYADV